MSLVRTLPVFMTLLTRRTLGTLGAVILVLGAIATFKYYSLQKAARARAAARLPPVSVAATAAAETAWQRQFHAVGTLDAVEGVTVSNELAGTVAQIAFESGQHVKRGDLLVQLDVSTDEAQLRGLEAQATLARITLERGRALRAANSNSQADLDSAEAQYQQALANVDNQRAVIAKKTIRAPFAGLLGIRQIDLGQYLAAGAAIVTLQALDPIYANFSLPEQDVTQLKAGQAVRLAVEAYPGEIFDGAINALNAKVDETTHSLQVQATVRNADERLVPGMFVRADVVLPREDRFVTLPATAIVYNSYGDAVYVIEEGADPPGGPTLVARQRFVELGETRGDQVAVVKGVRPGEQVVTAGQLKLRNGSLVQINNAVQPSANPAPTPPNT
ncbi:MAG TPA: efflux RND transporter periplasmic adaptor subunit [Opitutaceae bacterium]|nr:efflux RND transporter periplasmic adaptor subunit [Opitutaceae bacterium]